MQKKTPSPTITFNRAHFATKLLNVHGYKNIVFQTTSKPFGKRYLYNLVHTSAAQDVRGCGRPPTPTASKRLSWR
jgi:hypothetical protein